MPTKIAGVDMSKYQDKVDYKALAAGKINGYPVEFAMLRIGYGKYKDTLFDKHYSGCKAAGIKVGCYHWIRAQNGAEARAEAQWLVEKLEGYKLDYPVAMDFEDTDLFALKLSKARYTAIVDAFAKVLQGAGYRVILYTNPDTLENRLCDDVLDRYDLWLAHWVKTPAEYGQTMWQYAALGTLADVKVGHATAVGNVQGANAPIDVNWCYKDYTEQSESKAETVTAVVGTKIVKSASELTTAKNQLKAMGYTITTTDIKPK